MISVNHPAYLPREIYDKSFINICHRCKSHISSKINTSLSKAYWNNLDPRIILPEILILTHLRQRLLARIHPFLKIVKFSGLYGQYGFKGQAILFAKDICEVTEKLPTMLPRSTSDAGIVVTENLENLDITREYTVSKDNIVKALRWLIENNPLYHDVTIDPHFCVNKNDLIWITNDSETEAAVAQTTIDNITSYKEISYVSRILHASWHQANNVSSNKVIYNVHQMIIIIKIYY